MKNILLLLLAAITLANCTKPSGDDGVEIITITETVTQTIEVPVPVEVIDSPYLFDLTEFEDITNIIQIKEIAGSEGFRTWNYKELGELNALVEQGYIVLKNNSCCVDEADVTIHIITSNGRYKFNFKLKK